MNNKLSVDFFTIWRNIYIKKIIFNHIYLLNINDCNILNREFISLDEFIKFKRQYKYIDYVETIKINIKSFNSTLSTLVNLNHDNSISTNNNKHKLSYTYNHSNLNVTSTFPEIIRILEYFDDGNSNGSIVELSILHRVCCDHQDFVLSILKSLPSTVKKLNAYNVSFSTLSLGLLSNSNITHLSFEILDDEPLTAEMLPRNLISLEIGNVYNQEFGIGVLPNTLEHLKLGDDFKKQLKVECLPPSLKSIEILSIYNQPFDSLPSSLTSLKIKGYEGEIKQNILKETSLETLSLNRYRYTFPSVSTTTGSISSIFSNLFKSSIKNENNSCNSNTTMKSISIGAGCKKGYRLTLNIDFKLLSTTYTSLTSLVLLKFNSTLLPNVWFNQLKSLVYLKLNNFNNGDKPLSKNTLPCNLEYLDFGNYFNQDIEFEALPNKQLKYIKFGGCFSKSLVHGKLPASLETIKFGDNYPLISKSPLFVIQDPTKTILEYECKVYEPWRLSKQFIELISVLELNKFENQSNVFFPPNLKHLIFKDYCQRTHIITEYNFHESIFESIHSSLTILELPINFNKPLNRSLKHFTSLTSLQFRQKFNQPLENELPNSIKILKVGQSFNTKLLSTLSLPFLEHLYIDSSIIDDDYNFNNFKNLKTIYCNNINYTLLNSIDLNKYKINLINEIYDRQ